MSYSVKPTLKKVSKYENKFAKLQKKAAEFNFRNQLKVVKKKEFTLEEEEKEVRNDKIVCRIDDIETFTLIFIILTQIFLTKNQNQNLLAYNTRAKKTTQISVT